MKLILIYKQSKYEYERQKFYLSHDQLISKYQSEQANLPAILSSHDRQLKIRELFCDKLKLSNNQVYSLDYNIKPFIQRNHPLYFGDKVDGILVLGGDNSFTRITQLAEGIPVFGINSDPQTSVGCLLKWQANNEQDVNNIIANITSGQYKVEEWTRLKTKTLSAISELYLGETKRMNMSRHILEYRGQSYEQKCSGLIVSTGAGSTGWYKSVNWFDKDYYAFSPTEKRAVFTITEPYKINSPVYGVLEADEKLIVHSLNDDGGLISADSWTEERFERGCSAEISLGEPCLVGVPQ